VPSSATCWLTSAFGCSLWSCRVSGTFRSHRTRAMCWIGSNAAPVCSLSLPMSFSVSVSIHVFLAAPLSISHKRTTGRRPSIAIQRPNPSSPKGSMRSSKNIRSEVAWKELDERKNAVRYERYLAYAPKIVLPVSIRNLSKPLTKSSREAMEINSERLLSRSHPARCTSAQYVDRNGNPLLFYFGRRLVRTGDRKVGRAFVK
jgi:hypothetical protein